MSKWLFFPSPAAAGYLQEITWNMTGADTCTVSSSGQQIISATKTSQNTWAAGQPRFWNGAEAVNGANYSSTSGTGANQTYNFTSGATCRTWWNNYIVELQFNGGSWGSSSDPVQGSCQPGYINTSSGTFSTSGTAFVSGDTVNFRISAAS
jgi:hypothetical protein